MFTDIVGYTRMMGEDEKQALKLLRKSRSIHLRNIERHGGWFIKEMGDGVLAQFDSPLQATYCARDIQQEASTLLCKIRIGVHYGEITVENNDVFGNGVNIASRLQSAADPGGVFVSGTVYEHIEKESEMIFSSIGNILLKNVKDPVPTFALAADNLPKTSRQRIKVLTGSTEIDSIAVLPFQNLSEDSEQQFFVDGMHDALITELSQIKAIRVISRTSTLRYRNTEKSISAIAEELDVDALIEATVFKHENKVRIQVQLIGALHAEEHIWAESYDREVKNVLVMYQEVVKDITTQIGTTLTQSESENLTDATEVDPEAYECYLKGVHYWGNLSKKGLEESLRFFEMSTEKDPQFAPAYTGMAAVWGGRAQMGYISPNEALPNIYRNMYKSLDLDNNIADTYFFRGSHNVWMEWEWDKGYKSFKKALEINPNLAIARAYLSHLLAILGRMDESLLEIEQAIQLDPFNVLYQSLYGMVLNYTRHFDRAEAILLNILEENHDHPVAYSTLRSIYFNLEQYDKSYEYFKGSYAAKGDHDAVKALEEGYSSGGYQVALIKVAEHKIAGNSGEYRTPWQVATLYTRAGVKDKAIEYLKKAHQIKDPNMPYLGVDPIFDILKEEPEYLEILARMNLQSI